MKKILVIIALVPLSCFAQLTNKVTYKAAQIKNFLVQNYGTPNPVNITEQVLGVDVEIVVDTVFKQYKIYFKDEDYKRTYVTFSYVQDADLSNKNKDEYRPLIRTYKMVMQEKYSILYDFSDSFLHMMEIRFTEDFPNNCTMVWKINDMMKQ